MSFYHLSQRWGFVTWLTLRPDKSIQGSPQSWPEISPPLVHSISPPFDPCILQFLPPDLYPHSFFLKTLQSVIHTVLHSIPKPIHVILRLFKECVPPSQPRPDSAKHWAFLQPRWRWSEPHSTAQGLFLGAGGGRGVRKGVGFDESVIAAKDHAHAR